MPKNFAIASLFAADSELIGVPTFTMTGDLATYHAIRDYVVENLDQVHKAMYGVAGKHPEFKSGIIVIRDFEIAG